MEQTGSETSQKPEITTRTFHVCCNLEMVEESSAAKIERGVLKLFRVVQR